MLGRHASTRPSSARTICLEVGHVDRGSHSSLGSSHDRSSYSGGGCIRISQRSTGRDV